MSAPLPTQPRQRWGSARRTLSVLWDRGRALWPTHNVHVPVVMQMESVECGAASLAMILAYYGRILPLEEVRTACGVSRDGSKASNLVAAAKSFGLDVRAYRREPEHLKSEQLPAILHWNMNHFVVLTGFGPTGVHLNDPARGAVTVSHEEFHRSFSGILIRCAPAADFQRGGTQQSLIGALLPRLRGTGNTLTFVVLSGLLLLVPGIAVPAFARVFVDNILVKGLHAWLPPLLLCMIATLAIQATLLWVQQSALLKLETQLALRGAAQFLWHVLRLPYGFFTQRNAGEIATRVAASDRIARLLSSELATTALDLILVATYAVLMAQYDGVLTAIGVATALANLAAVRYTARKRAQIAQHLQQERGKMIGGGMAGLQAIETLKAGAEESAFFARWSGTLARYLNANQKLGVSMLLLGQLPAFVVGLNSALMLGIGGYRVMSGELTMGMLLAFQTLLLAFLAPVGRVLTTGGQLHEVQAGLRRLDDVLAAPPDPQVPERPGQRTTAVAPTTHGRLSGRIELQGVTFGYSRVEAPLVRDFSLTLNPGSRVALVGKSGSGKSTVAKLITGLYTPWSGEILFDGQPRSALPRELIVSSLSVVEQDVFLFEGTIRENLTLWDTTIPEGDIVAAARDACIYDDIASRTGGLTSVVEEGGRNFSGGQRQRLEIARALAGRPTILVLDEATSALDPSTEKAIDDHLRRRGCTCVIVAHRLSTIRDCDEIVVMEGGRIVQRGTHDQLVAVPGLYHDLVHGE